MKLIIALSGWKKSGKDTAGDHIINTFGFHRISLADALKHNTAVQYGIPLEFFHEQELKEKPIKELPASTEACEKYYEHLSVGPLNSFWTPRALLIHEGLMKRLVMDDYWVRALSTTITAAEVAGTSLFVLTDLRFKKEVAAMSRHYPEYKLLTVRINRFNKPPNNDPTERDLDNFKFDHVVDNKGTLEELHEEISYLVGNIINDLRRQAH
jgi:hypothetical protein